ncbi:MAG: thiamine-phosphate kinase [Deltaproteobacteria bacterium]|nr:thiamine-phosphate kinase [Deltaproteobacteria bacterium]
MSPGKDEDSSLGEIGERKIIREIFLKNIPSSAAFDVGPGDDAAVLRPVRGKTVVTTDMLVEDVHFDLTYFPADLVGEKSILVNLSDIAAMGARPLAAFVGIGLPEGAGTSFVRQFARGMKRALRRYGVSLGGGDTVRAEKFVIAVTLIGVLKGPPVNRSGARMGDQIYLSGIPGLSHLGLSLLRDGCSRKKASRTEKKAFDRHLRPEVDIELGCFIRERKVATAMIDTSDGIFADLGHMLRASKAGATIDLSEVPVSAGLKKAALRFGYEWEDAALFGGEDYHLLFTASPKKVGILSGWTGKSRIHRIGSIDRKRGIYLQRKGRTVKLPGRAKPFFNHFAVREIKDH